MTYSGELFPAPSYVMLINGSAYIPANGKPWTSVLKQDQWSVSQQFGRQAATATFYLYDERQTPAATFVPISLQTIQLIDTTLSKTLFAGVITKPTMKFESANSTLWELECVDYGYYADASTCLGDFSYQQAGKILKVLTASAGSGINANLTTDNPAGFVQPGPLIARYRAEYIPLSDAWTQVAKLAAGVGRGAGTNLGGVTWGWYVDENLFLHFYPQASAPTAGVTFTDNVTGNPSPSVGFIEPSNLTYEFDGANLRDSVIVWGGNVHGTKTDTFHGDGVTKQWPLTFQILSTNPRVTLKVQGIKYTCGIATQDPTVTTSQQRTQYIVTQNANGQWILQTGTNLATPPAPQLAPSAGTTLSLQYNFQAPIAARVDDRSEEITLGGSKYNSSATTTFTNNSATDSLATWTTNQFAGLRVGIVGGNASTAQVISNTSNTLTTTTWYPTQPTTGSLFVVGWSPNNGVFQVAIKDKTILDMVTAQNRAQQELNEYSKLQERISFDTIENWPGHIFAGETFKLTSLFIPDSQAAFASTLSNATFFINSVKIAPSPGLGGFRKYSIQAQRIS